MNRMLSAVCLSVMILTLPVVANAQGYQIREVTESVLILHSQETGDKQAVIKSEKGLVVFNTWSTTMVQEVKEGITAALNRDDFAYTVNTIDRLDILGRNAAYQETTIVGHDFFLEKYQGKDDAVQAEIRELIDMWRWKENVARERLPEHEPGSEAAIREQNWINTCVRTADELENNFTLVLPIITFSDRVTLNLGNATLKLIWFGVAGDQNGMSVAVIPEEDIAIIPGFIMHPQHLAPYPHPEYRVLDVPRWIAVLEEVLEGENAVETVICGINDIWTRERALTRLNYIRRLWNSVRAADAAGQSLSEIHEQLSFENEFAFVKELQSYQARGDEWFLPQHQMHVRLFFLQGKILASEIIRQGGWDVVETSLATIRELRTSGGDIYIEEGSINGLGYQLMGLQMYAKAIEVLKLNVEVFPESANTYDSLGEAYMASGDHENAIVNYRRSLELNPENENARQMLERLGDS